MISREIHSAMFDMGQCTKAPESAFPGDPGPFKGSYAVTMRVEHALTFDADDGVEVENTPLQRRKRVGNNSTLDPGPASSSPNVNAIEVF